MKYSWKEVKENMLTALVVSFVFVLMTIVASHALCWWCSIDGKQAQCLKEANIVLWGLMLWFIFQFCFLNSYIRADSHGWFWKIVDLSGSNISFAFPFVVAFLLTWIFRQ